MPLFELIVANLVVFLKLPNRTAGYLFSELHHHRNQQSDAGPAGRKHHITGWADLWFPSNLTPRMDTFPRIYYPTEPRPGILSINIPILDRNSKRNEYNNISKDWIQYEFDVPIVNAAVEESCLKRHVMVLEWP